MNNHLFHKFKVSEWFNTQAAKFFEEMIHEVVTHYKKCFNCYGKYKEKYLKIPISIFK